MLSLIAEVLVISGVAMDLLGAVLLAYVHSTESVVELREEIEGEARAFGQTDSVSTHAVLLARKRIGFLILAGGLSLYLAGLVLRTTEGIPAMLIVALAILAIGTGLTLLWIQADGRRLRAKALRAMDKNADEDVL
jgi:hypothetical protein